MVQQAVYAGNIGAGHVHLQKNGFLEEQLSSALAKNASKKAKAMYACVE